MKAPVALSREVLEGPRKTYARKVNYDQLIGFIKQSMEIGGPDDPKGGDIELDAGESSKSAKKRLTNAMKLYDDTKRLVWLNEAPEGHVWFVIENKPEESATPRVARRKKSADSTPEPEFAGTTA